jgi:hypothetical protein
MSICHIGEPVAGQMQGVPSAAKRRIHPFWCFLGCFVAKKR